MFRIGEFARLGQVSVRMLRYYDEMGLLKPRQVDAQTGYRMYAAQQLETLRRILFLRDIGLPTAQMAEGLARWENGDAATLLKRQKQQTEQEMAALAEKKRKIETALQDMQSGRLETHCAITLKSVPAAQVFCLRETVEDYYAEGPLWKKMAAYAQAHGIEVGSDTFTIYYDGTEGGVDMELCAPVAKRGEDRDGFAYRMVAAVPLMASMTVRGPFENISGAYADFAAWLGQNPGYRMGSSSRQIVHRGPWNEADPAQYLTEMQIPLEML